MLGVEGANGQSVPYIGYIEMNVTFPEEFLKKDIEVPTLALVVPDVKTYTESLVLIGTNTLDVLYDQYSKSKSHNHQSPLFGYKAVLKTLELRQKQTTDGNLGLVRSQSKEHAVIPAGQTVVLEGSVTSHGLHSDKWVVVQYPIMSSLLGGIIVKSCLFTLPTRQPCHLPVVLTNETERNVTIPPSCVIAELHVVQSVHSKEQSVSSPGSAVYGHTPDQKSELAFNFGESPIPQEWKERITEMLKGMPEVFAQHELDFGRTQQVKHHINLTDETLFKHRARPIHPKDLDAVRTHLQVLLESGVIRESESSFSSPIVVVRKKNGDVRLCIDYRKLNLQTVKDAYALPNLEETFSALNGSKWFSVLDLKSGYYQIKFKEAEKPKTAFTCPLGFWEFKCMGDINLKEVLVFLDDLIIFSENLEEHESRWLRVLDRLKQFGLKLSPEKCKFFQKSVRYLGHIVSENGVATDPEKIQALKTWPRPKNLKELRSFL